MKQTIKNSHFMKCMFFAGLLAFSVSSSAQKAAVMADPELGKIAFTNETGFALDASQIQADQVISLRIPVLNDGHGQALPAGSCKIKIGFGSKLVLDPQFNINNTALSSYFKWSFDNTGGQLQVTGELIAPLPASVTNVNVAFKVKASKEGQSTITANFLITNHNTASVLSDEDGTNNTASLSYKVNGKVAVVNGDKLKLSLYPNPVKDVRSVMIKADKGELKGNYNITLLDVSGKVMQSSRVELLGVPGYLYKFGLLAAGKYLLKVAKDDASESFVLKFEKM